MRRRLAVLGLAVLLCLSVGWVGGPWASCHRHGEAVRCSPALAANAPTAGEAPASDAAVTVEEMRAHPDAAATSRADLVGARASDVAPDLRVARTADGRSRGDDEPKREDAAPIAERGTPLVVRSGTLVGTWMGDDGTRMRLRPDGTFEMTTLKLFSSDDWCTITGRFTIDGGRLRVWLDEDGGRVVEVGAPQSGTGFTGAWTLDGDTLSDGLDDLHRLPGGDS